MHSPPVALGFVSLGRSGSLTVPNVNMTTGLHGRWCLTVLPVCQSSSAEVEKCTVRDDDKLHLEMDVLIGQKVAMSVSEFSMHVNTLYWIYNYTKPVKLYRERELHHSVRNMEILG